MSEMKNEVLIEGYIHATGSSIGYKIGYKRFYFVLTNCLSYYETKESFQSGSKEIGVLKMEAFSILRIEARGKYQLVVNAYVILLSIE